MTTVDAPAATPVWVAEPEPGLEPPSEPGRPSRRRLLMRLVRGRPDDPGWVRPALLAVLASTAVLYLWDLGASGWANSFYSAAVQASTKSWKAFLFGSFDASNFITVDKPPASLWLMDLSARVFGVNAWSILVPDALVGVATVALVYATVRRWFSAGAGLIAAAVTALTPVAVLMFRFDNPDALLVLLLTAATYAVTRAVEHASVRWLALAGALIGFGFLTKMLQAFLVVPAFALVYLIAAPTTFWRRVRHLLVAAGSLAVAGGWWVALVELWPASSRPYVGGSQDNSVLNLIFGYNGFGRVTGNETGSVTGGLAGRLGGSMWGPTGWSRLLNSQFGGQDAWLIPAALASVIVLLALSLGAPRTDRLRAAVLLWGGSLVGIAGVISFSQGIIHPYYTIALAPAIGALVGIGATELWSRRTRWWSRAVLASAVLGTAVWSAVLLDRTPGWHPWIRTAVVVAAGVAAVALLVRFRLRRLALVVAGLGSGIAVLLGPAAYSVATAAQPHAGAIPSAGPSGAGLGGFGPGGGPPGGFARAFPNRARGAGGFPGFGGAHGRPSFPGGVPGGAGFRNGTGTFRGAPGGFNFGNGTNPFGAGGPRPGGGFGRVGGGGGLLGSSTSDPALTRLLENGASHYTWVAATVGADNAAGYQLATGDPVMALGGFNGSDPAPTLAQFQADVAAHKVHYFIGGGGIGRANGGSNDAQQIETWVANHFTATSVGGVTLYNLAS